MFRIYRAGVIGTLAAASLAVSLVSTGPATAAGGALCYTLAAKDCQILSTAEANVATEKSFQADFDFTGSISGSGATRSTTASGSLLLSYDPALLSNSTALFQSLIGKMTVTGALSSTGVTPALNQKGTVNYIALKGILYNQNSSGSGWTGYSLDQQIQAFNSGFQSALDQSSNNASTQVVLSFLQDPSLPALFNALPTIKGFVKLAKTTNTPTLDGQKQVEFIYSYDLPTLIKSKEMLPVLRAILAASSSASGSNTNFTDAQLAAAASILGRLFNGSTITLTRWVGTTDNSFHALIVDTTLKFDPASISAFLPPSTSNLLKAGTLKARLTVKLTKLNQPLPAITAPANATLIITPTESATNAAPSSDTSNATPTAIGTPAAGSVGDVSEATSTPTP